MKKVLMLFAFLFFTVTMNAQQERIVKLDDNLFEMTIQHANIWQRGTFKVINDRKVNHGNWIMKMDGKFKMKGKYNKGELIRLTVNTSEGKKTYTHTDLKLIRHERKIYKLEKMLSLRE